MAALMDMLPCPNPWCPDSDPVAEMTLRYMGDESPRRVECGCGMRGPVKPTETEAIAAWNHRLAHSEPRPVAGEDIGGLSWGGKFAVTGTSASIHEVERLVNEHDHLASSVESLRARLATHSPAPTEALVAAMATAGGISSGPDGTGRMKVVVSGLEPGQERKLHYLLSDAATSTQGGAEG